MNRALLVVLVSLARLLRFRVFGAVCRRRRHIYAGHRLLRRPHIKTCLICGGKAYRRRPRRG